MNWNSARATACALLSFVTLSLAAPAFAEQPIYQDLNRSFEDRAADLVSRMTLEEKVSQLQNDAVAIPRLSVPAYEWWNEALHGVARAGADTVFPQAIGMAATFDTPLMTQIATAIREVRNAGKRAGDEVVQPYLRPVEPLRPRAFKELRGVERVTLKAGESRVVRFSISPARDLAIYDDVNKAYAVDAGQFEVQIGASSADIRAKAALDVTH